MWHHPFIRIRLYGQHCSLLQELTLFRQHHSLDPNFLPVYQHPQPFHSMSTHYH
eukprot:c1518_g1_i1 orf=642-803(+)